MRRVRSAHIWLVLLAAYCSIGAYQCRIGPTPPSSHTLSVPYHRQIDPDWCVPATILMWLDLVSSNSYQDSYESQIWNWAVQRGWAGPGGTDNDRIDDVASNFLPFTVTRWGYGSSMSERRSAVADQERALDFGDPTLVEANGGFHAVLFIGASWHDLPPLAQPNQDYVVVHDPLDRPNDQVSLSFWLGVKGSTLGGGAANIMRYSRGIGGAQLQEFEESGGTYYGDPAPPTAGRWKLQGGACAWDPNAFGSNECSSTCSYNVSPSSATVGPENGALGFEISTAAGCPWSVSLRSNFVYLSTTESGTGPATVVYGVENYTAYDEPRYAELVIAGTSVVVTQTPQGGGGDACESESAHDHYGACGSTDSCGHSFGSDSDCGCPNAPVVSDTCYQTVCDTASTWVDEYCQGTTTVCDWDEYCYWNSDGFNYWWQCDWYPYNCREEPYSYACGGHWEEYQTNCREEPYECNPHQC
jgi:hypothetical protein